MSEDTLQTEVSDAAKLEKQYAFLPPAWRFGDRLIIRATEISLFVVGLLFALMVTLEVVSRYVFNFSIFFVDGAARLLLLWFFLLGAGLALRYGAHVGFELLVGAVPQRLRRFIILFAQLITLLYFLELVWGGYMALAPASRQLEPSLEVSMFWAFLAIPVGFALLAYHMIVLIYLEIRRIPAAGGRS